MIAIVTFATAPTKTPNVVVGNAAGLTWNPASKAFEAAPSGTYTTPTIPYGSGLLANNYVAAIPDLPAVVSAGDVILYFLDGATNLSIAAPYIVPAPRPGPGGTTVSVVVQGVDVLVVYGFRVTNGGLSAPGLAPTWESFQLLTGATATPPAITPLAAGWYTFAWDAQANGDACGTIDAGATVTDPYERFLGFEPTRENGIILANSLISVVVSQ